MCTSCTNLVTTTSSPSSPFPLPLCPTKPSSRRTIWAPQPIPHCHPSPSERTQTNRLDWQQSAPTLALPFFRSVSPSSAPREKRRRYQAPRSLWSARTHSPRSQRGRRPVRVARGVSIMACDGSALIWIPIASPLGPTSNPITSLPFRLAPIPPQSSTRAHSYFRFTFFGILHHLIPSFTPTGSLSILVCWEAGTKESGNNSDICILLRDSWHVS